MKKIIAETSKTVGIILLGVILAGVVGWIRRQGLISSPGQYYTYVVVLTGWLVITFPVGELIGQYLKRKEPAAYRGPGLVKAGKVIGRLERTIILIFFLGGSLEGIAFLVVAKSIYRFGDLRKGSKDGDGRSEEVTFSVSEYIILGSLLSITVALLGGLITQLVLRGFGLPPLF
jgi:hypothetical protein